MSLDTGFKKKSPEKGKITIAMITTYLLLKVFMVNVFINRVFC